MAYTSQAPLTIQPDGHYEGRATQRRVSGRSWISSLASPNTTTPTSPPAVPVINITSQSPVSPARTIKLGNLSVPASRTRQAMPGDLDPDSSADSMSTDEDKDKDVTAIKYGMSTVDELTECPASPTTPVTARVGGKARSIVDGLVSGLRSIPKAVTHNQLHDRRSSVGSRTSHYTGVGSHTSHYTAGTDHRTTMTVERDNALAFKFAPPGPFPAFVFAPAGYPPPSMATPMSLDHDPMSKLGSDGDAAETNAEDDTHLARITNLFSSLYRMPWISPTRVAVDYIPGNSRKCSVPAHKTKNSSSWYTMTAPATPSDISVPWRTLPEPWFPPAELPTTMEDPEAEAGADGGQENVDGEEGQHHEEHVEEKLRELREELQEKNRQLSDLRQVVEHQKLRISVLEADLEELRKAEAQQEEQRRGRSSVRRSTLHPRDSLGVAAARRTSIRVSRPGSSYFD